MASSSHQVLLRLALATTISLLLLCGVHGSHSSDDIAAAPAAGMRALTSTNSASAARQAAAVYGWDGFWGDWKGRRDCPPGTWVSGLNTRIEGNQGRGDDTAMNSVKMVCTDEGSKRSEIGDPAAQGEWGSWSGWQNCPRGYHLAGLRVKIELKQGVGDDTAMNAIEGWCSLSKMQSAVPPTSILVMPTSGDFGVWSEWRRCPYGQRISWFRLRIEAPQGSGDDTALNGLQFGCSVPY